MDTIRFECAATDEDDVGAPDTLEVFEEDRCLVFVSEDREDVVEIHLDSRDVLRLRRYLNQWVRAKVQEGAQGIQSDVLSQIEDSV